MMIHPRLLNGDAKTVAEPMPQPRILIIEDERGLIQSLTWYFNREGYETIVAGDGQEGLRKAQAHIPDVVLLDLMLPGLGGLEVCRELRSSDRTREIPIIIITAHADVPMAVMALRAGAVDFIEKPFRDEVLLASMRSAMAGPKDQRARLGYSQAESRLRTLSYREREVMLLVVAGHPNKVVASRLGISTRTVEVHRAHIMEKTDAASLADLVRLACLFDNPLQEQR